MKGKKCIKLLILSIICLLSLKVCSNANALQYSLNLKPTGTVWSPVQTYCVFIDPTDNTQKEARPSANGDCTILSQNATDNIPVNFIRSFAPYPYGFKEEKVYSAIISTSNSVTQFNPVLWTSTMSGNYIRFLGFNKISSDRKADYCTNWTNYSTNNPYNFCSMDLGAAGTDFYEIYFIKIQEDPTNYLYFGSLSGSPSTLFLVPNGTNIMINSVIEYDYAGDEALNEKDNQDRENIENQSENNQTEADDAGDEATETGTSLFNAFTQLLTALTNVNGSSCTLPAMQVYSLNLGNMNLCEYNIPPQIMALVSIGMVFIIVPLGIHLVKRMIGLYKEITG